MSDLRCTYVLTRGPRKDQVCNSQKGVKSFNGCNYCYEHLRGKAVQQQLVSQGFSLEEITKPTPITPSAPSAPSAPVANKLSQPVKPRPIPKQPKQESQPKPKESPVETFKSGWVDSFKSGLEEELSNDNVNFDRLFDDIDNHSSTPSTDFCAPTVVSPPSIPNIVSDDDSDDDDDDSDDEVELPDHLKQSPEDKAQIGQFCSKQIIATGINTMALIAENTFKPKLNGFQDNVMTSEELNKVVDQLAIEYNEALGIGNLSPTMQLFLCLSVVGMQTYSLNAMLGPQSPSKIPLVAGVRQPEPKVAAQPSNFAPAYPD